LENHLLDPEAYAWLHLGYVLLDMDQLSDARDAFARSRSGWTSLGRTPLAMEATAGLAEVALRQRNLDEAMASVESVLQHMAEQSLDGADELFQIYLTCCKVLSASADARTKTVLDEAHKLLIARAGYITDDESRDAFWHKVPAHQETMALWKRSN
jgi:hypothetical protein